MSRTIDHDTGEIIPEEQLFELLDAHGRSSAPRPDWIATLSLGERKRGERDGREYFYPSVNRDGTFSLHDPDGRAPALRKLLEAGGRKSLTVAVTSDRISDFLQQHYVRYSASAVEAFGDQHAIVEFVQHDDGHTERHVRLAGTDEYNDVRATCKVHTSLYFVLADWIGQEVRISFPDGFGQYRFRTSGRSSLASIVGKIQEIQALTRGRIAGIPLTMSVSMRDLAGPDGKRQKLPVCTLALKPPEAIQLTSRNWGEIIGRAIAEAQSLRMLAAPREETEQDVAEEPEPEQAAIEDAQTERVKGPDTPITQGQIIVIHTLVKQLGWSDDDYRHVLGQMFRVSTSKDLTEGQATELIESLYLIRVSTSKDLTEGQATELIESLYLIRGQRESPAPTTPPAPSPSPAPTPSPSPTTPPAPSPSPTPTPSPSPTPPPTPTSQQIPTGAWVDRTALMRRWGKLWNEARDRGLSPPEMVSTTETDESVRDKIGRLEKLLADA